jgi:PAS domain S-box-containing protein
MFQIFRWARHVLILLGAPLSRKLSVSNETEQAEQLIHALFTHSVDALYIISIDHDGKPRFINWNSVAARAVGKSAEEGVGKTLGDVLSPESARRAADEIAQVVSERRALRFKQHISGTGGEKRTLDVVHVPLLGPDGNVTRIFISLRDVTQFERVEQELRVKTALLEATLDHMDQGLLVIGEDRRIPLANRRAKELLGLPSEIMLSSPSYDEVVRYQVEAQEFGFVDEKALSFIDGGPPSLEPHVLERTRRNGTALEIRTVPFGEKGAIRTYTDITERRQAEAARVESQERYRKLAERLNLAVEVTGLGTWDTDLRDGTRYWSAEMRSILGLEPELPVRENTFLVCVHPDDREWVAERFYSSIAQAPDQGYRAEFRIVRADDGTERWVALYGKRFLDEYGTPIRTVGTIQDITERRNQAIELEISKQAAEQANQAKTEFLATMSHEIRTPLNGILGYTDIILWNGHLTDEQRHQLGRIQTAGSALLTIVNDVLDFSRIEAGYIELDPQPFGIMKLIEDAVGIVEEGARRKGLELSVVVSGDLPKSVVGDEDRLRQILLNLLNNAIKFTPEGKVSLQVHGAPLHGGDMKLRFSVSDTGVGIRPDHQDLIFRQFTQADGSIRRKYGGTGLGLAISKQLIELMGGLIGVSSQPGTGSTFWFDLTVPVAGDQRGHDATPERAGDRQPLRILLVEDNEINQELGKAVLETVGHVVDIASDGSVAVTMVQSAPYDIVLMDVQMPVMDGIAATGLIRALDHAARNVPIIAMTANVLPQQIESFRRAGMDAHIGKPFKREELLAAIDRLAAR